MVAIDRKSVPAHVMEDFMNQIENKNNPSLIVLKRIAEGNFFEKYKQHFPSDAGLIDRIIFLREYAKIHGTPSTYVSTYASIHNKIDNYHKLASALRSLLELHVGNDDVEQHAKDSIIRAAQDALAEYQRA